jgi:hypothetical protein
MRVRWVPCARVPRPLWAVVLVCAWIGAVLAVALAHQTRPSDGTGPLLCNFKRFSGMPCPTCGGTRAAMAVLGGDPLAALMLNPLVAAGGVFLLFVLVIRVATARTPQIQTSRRGWLLIAAGVCLVLAANWWYVIASGL